jgi:hypothetical protein
VFNAKSDLEDGADHQLVTSYAVKRPDGNWAVMAVNRDQSNAHKVRIMFDGSSSEESSGAENSFVGPVEILTFGSRQYQWHPAQMRFMAHAEESGKPTIVPTSKGWADPDGPIAANKLTATKDTIFDLPAASVTVIRGNISDK